MIFLPYYKYGRRIKKPEEIFFNEILRELTFGHGVVSKLRLLNFVLPEKHQIYKNKWKFIDNKEIPESLNFGN